MKVVNVGLIYASESSTRGAQQQWMERKRFGGALD
jgi:hypothetical protein